MVNKDRRTVTVQVVSQEKYGKGPFCFGSSWKEGTLDKVIQSLTDIRDSIPPKHRAKTFCEITSVSSYGDGHYPKIEISYERPETFAERDERIEKEKANSEAEEKRDKELLAKLKRKYEKGK